MKYLSLIILIACFAACKNDVPMLKKMQGNFNETGIVTVSLDTPLPLYATSDDKEPYDNIIFSRVLSGKEKGSIAIKTKHLKSRLKPYQMTGGSSDAEGEELINVGLGPWPACLTFRVISSTPQYFEVLINDVSKETAYIKKEGRTLLNSQNENYSQVEEQQRKFQANYFVYETWPNFLKRCEYISITNYDVYTAPNTKPLKRVVAGDYFKVVDVNGDWAKVIKNDTPIWILWRKNNKLTMVPVEYTVD